MKYNRNLMYNDYYGEWFTDGNTLIYYYYGDVALSFELGEGNWRVIKGDTIRNKTEDGNYVEYDADGNGRVTVDEIRNAVSDAEMLLYNAADNTIWRLANGEMTCILQDVVDYCEAYGLLYWMDSNNNAYELSLEEGAESVLIGEEVVGISKYQDERAGFLVKPDDPRCNAGGFGEYFCTLYGREWLNQEKTSGAWALEYNWDE